MAFSIVGNEVRGGAGKTLDSAPTHSQAVAAATERAAGGSPAVSIQNTAFAVVALDFSGAKPFRRQGVDLALRRGEALAKAAAGGADPAALGEISSKPDADFEVLADAVQVVADVQHAGAWHPAGSWVVRIRETSQVEVLSPEAFTVAYQEIAEAKKKGK